MSDTITLEDGRTWSAANWLWRYVVRAIGEELARVPCASDLSEWLLDLQEHGPNGCSGFDVRGFDASTRHLFWKGAHLALARHLSSDPNSWSDPVAFAGATQRFQELLLMRDAVLAGEPPEQLNHLRDTWAFDGEAIDLRARCAPDPADPDDGDT